MESSARTEKMELLRLWWWWWWLRSTRKGFEEEECHCCCLEFVEFTIKDGTSPLDWSSTSLNTPLNLPFTSIKALIATSVILFLSHHAYTHTYTSIYLVKLKLLCFQRVPDLGNNKNSNQSNGTTKIFSRQKEIQNYKSDLPHSQNCQSKFWQVSILESLSQVRRRDGIHHLECDVHVVLNIWHWFSDSIVDLLRELVDHLRHLCLALFVFLPSSRLLFPLTRQHGIQEIRVLQTPKTLTLILWMATQQPTTTGRVEATYPPTYLPQV